MADQLTSFRHEELTPEEQATVNALVKFMPFVLQRIENLRMNPPFGKLDQHDIKVVLFHAVVALIQTYLIGAKVEYPQYALLIQTAAEFLRRLVY